MVALLQPIKSNTLVKLKEVLLCNLRKTFFKISWLSWEQYEKNQYKKETQSP